LSNGFGGNGTGTPRAPGANGGTGFFPGGGDAGGPPGGGDRGGGGGFGIAGTTGANGGARPTANATQQALRAQFANRIPTPLMNALVTYLQKIAGS
jgi:hypothetical protein